MNKEEITHSQSEDESEDKTIYGQSDEEEETFTKKEMKETIIRNMKDIADDLFARCQDFVLVASATFAISFITLAVIRKSYNKWTR